MTRDEKIDQLHTQVEALVSMLNLAKAELLAIEQDRQTPNEPPKSTPDSISDMILGIRDLIHKVKHNLL